MCRSANRGTSVDLATFFSNLNPSQVSLGALVTFVIVAYWRGWIVPRKSLDDVRADRDARIAEFKQAYQDATALVRDTERARVEDMRDQRDAARAEAQQWQNAYLSSDKSVAELIEQTSELREVARTAEHVLVSLPQPPLEEGNRS